MDIIVSGSIAYDYLMRFPGRFVEHLMPEHLHQVSLSFLVENMTKNWGGVAANIAYTMGLFGLRPKLFGTVGRDFGDYREWLQSVGVDTSTVQQINDVFTASFFCNTDLENNQIASFYSGAMAYAKDYAIGDVFSGVPDMVVVSPNDPQAMLQLTDECREKGYRFVYDPSQQVPRFNGEELARSMQGAHIMFCNAYEAELIAQKSGYSIDRMQELIDILVITQGKRGSHIYTGGQRIDVPVYETLEIKDPTGVGDAFRAGFLCGVAYDLPIKLSAEIGTLSAAYVVEQVGTQSHHFTPQDFVERFRVRWDDEGLLDALLDPTGDNREVVC